jgi:hypothetical protein
MPRNAIGSVVEKRFEALVLSTAVHEMHFRVPFWSAGCWMDVQTSKISAIVQCLLDGQLGEVLVSKCHDFLLSDQQCKFVLAGVCQLRELDARNLSANGGGDVLDLDALWQQIWEGRIRVLAVLDMLEWLEGRISVATISNSASVLGDPHSLHILLILPSW